MTKEEIKAAVAAKIAGQGSMVDISGALPAILDAIVDAIPEGGGGNEPLIVEGTKANEGYFVPNSGQPTKAEAIEAAKNGRLVIIKIVSSDDENLWNWFYLNVFYEYDETFSFETGITWG